MSEVKTTEGEFTQFERLFFNNSFSDEENRTFKQLSGTILIASWSYMIKSR
ncbi:hypothetical protein [Lactococcus sp. DD01]|uniref:hypothetical protein n=1 Tax=Lactococcus sp. DD01 TaxID=1776443 RepID=UPI000794CE93|nr:hypothetical protein [Lactococcus sp. DD01]KXT59400.1 hypothetical protein LACDD01_02095 [Lactococcus sp. DD01]